MTDQDSDSNIRSRAIEAYDGARDSVAGAGRRATEGIDEAPLIAIAAGLAAGDLAASWQGGRAHYDLAARRAAIRTALAEAGLALED